MITASVMKELNMSESEDNEKSEFFVKNKANEAKLRHIFQLYD